MVNWLVLGKIQIGLRGSEVLPASTGTDDEHLLAALAWIEEAWKSTERGGISKGYDLIRGQWAPSYPETTGYTIPTLLNAARYLVRPELEKMALKLADFLLENSDENGTVVHWKADENAKPVVFDTGQVLFGLIAAFRTTGDSRYLNMAVRAGNWLASIQSSGGSWKNYQHLGIEKVIDTRVAWSLLELNRLINGTKYSGVAMNNLEWAYTMQDSDGWFQRCSFREQEDPLTHTLAYTAEGLYECGVILDEKRFQKAGQLTADALMHLQRSDGSLSGTYGPGWNRPASWSCLTGNVQMSRLWLRLYEDTGDQSYYIAARQALDFVKRCQDLNTPHPGVRGGVEGSFPIYGQYERFKYPNWAAKFFIDAILAFAQIDKRTTALPFNG